MGRVANSQSAVKGTWCGARSLYHLEATNLVSRTKRFSANRYSVNYRSSSSFDALAT